LVLLLERMFPSVRARAPEAAAPASGRLRL